MMTLRIKNYDQLQQLVEIFFDKVTLEPMFVEVYAKLCKKMCQFKVPPPPGVKENQATFRVLLLTKCQTEFESGKTIVFEDPEEKRKKLEAELPEGPDQKDQIETILYHMKLRRLKFHGNIRFIGELFKLSMLTENIMHDCIFRLLKARDDESLLSLRVLITAVGSILDTENAKQRMDQYFAQMIKIAEDRKPRIKFALKDVIELRQNNWVPRKEQPRPKKIDDIREDFYQEQEVIQFSKTQSPPSWRRRKRKSMQRQGEFLGLTIDLSSLNFSEDASESSSASTQQVSQDNILGELRMLIQDGRPNSDVQMYIKDNIPREQEEKTIVRLLITAVIKASLSTAMKLNIDILTSRQGLLQHYIKTPELELQALYAIQALMHQLEHPSGVIASVFDFLYYEEIISEEAFKQWEVSTDEQEGKATCSLQLTQFFTWLQENEMFEAS